MAVHGTLKHRRPSHVEAVRWVVVSLKVAWALAMSHPIQKTPSRAGMPTTTNRTAELASSVPARAREMSTHDPEMNNIRTAKTT
jgi:hypothetical protein